jgi:hypothetical protein
LLLEVAKKMENTNGNETRVKLIVGSSTITETPSDSISAMDLISKLPYTVRVGRSSVDYCGVLPQPIKNDKAEGQLGWKDEEISYIPGADYIAFFFDGEDESVSCGYSQHIVGMVNDLGALKSWPQVSITVKIELL